MAEKKEDTFSANSLLVESAFSYTKIQSLTEDINQDLLALYQQPIFSDEGKITFNHLLFDSGRYQTYLLTQSVNYQFLMSVLLEPDFIIEDFCEHYYISRATLHRKITPIRQYLQKRRVNLNLTKMTLKGSESYIRSFYFHMSWHISAGNDILNQPVIKHSFAQFASWNEPWDSHLCHRQARLYLAIAQLRLEQGNSIEAFDYSLYHFPKRHRTIDHFFSTFTQTERQNHAEQNFFYYFIIYMPIYLTSKDPRIPIVEASLRQADFESVLPNYLTNYIANLIEEDIDYQDLFLFQLNFYKLLITLKLRQQSSVPITFQNNTYTQFANDHFKNKISKQLAKHFTRLSKQPRFRWIHACLPELVDSTTRLVLPYAKRENKADFVAVGIQKDPNYFLIQEITTLCETLPFVKAEMFSHVTEKHYDVIITNSVHEKGDGLEDTLLFTLQNGDFSYTKLLSLLESQHEEKAEV
jgi:hypothetical protein